MTTFGSASRMTRPTRPISWVSAAQKSFAEFPREVQSVCLAALTIAAEGGKADVAKPLTGMGSGVLEIARPFRGDAYRVVYAVQLAADLWVIHAFKKKATRGIRTPRHEIELVKDRLARLKDILQ